MTVTPFRRLFVVPGVIERADGEAPGPVEAIRRLLASHPLAPHLLSEARHRAVLSRDSAAEAVQATRSARDAELAHELAVRETDPRGHRRIRFWLAVVAAGALLIICLADAFELTRALPLADRAVVSIAGMALFGAAAWRVSIRRERSGEHHPIVLGVAAWAAVLATLYALSTGGLLALRIGAAALLSVVLVAAELAVSWVMAHGEDWRCYRLRWASNRASQQRQAALTKTSDDEAAAAAALAAWESLVVEECQLAHPADSASETWLADCVSVARRVATPE